MSRAASRLGRATGFVRDVFALYRERDIPFLAGSVAYSAFVSLIPLALLLVIVATVVGGDSFRTYVLDVAKQYLTPGTVDVVDQSLSNATGSVGFSLFGGLALLWAALKLFRTLDKAFSNLYGRITNAGLLDQLRDGTIVLVAMTVAVLAMVAAGTALAFAPSLSTDSVGFTVPMSSLALRAVSAVVLVLGLAIAFLPMYYVFPNVDVTVREVVPGAVLAAVGWTLLQALFQVYVSMTSTGELYGVIGGVILFVTWLYFGAVVLLLGEATNVVLAGRDRPRPYAMESASSRRNRGQEQ